MEKPFSPACERNQQAIFDVLKTIIKPSDRTLLEIGTGTAQHALYIAAKFPYLNWHTSDLKINHAGINLVLEDSKQKNIHTPIEYEVSKTNFPNINADIVFTSNTLHIMSWEKVQVLIKQLGESLKNETKIIIYGPFNYQNKFTSESNAEFEEWLKERNQESGIRDFESIVSLMLKVGISLVTDIEMPANNRLLHFIKNKI